MADASTKVCYPLLEDEELKFYDFLSAKLVNTTEEAIHVKICSTSFLESFFISDRLQIRFEGLRAQ